VCVALGNRRDAGSLPALARAADRDPSPLVRGHAAWALGRIGAAHAAERGAARAALGRCALDADAGVREEAALALAEVSA